jgi:ADP-ribose pyrophosphatase
MPSRPPELPKVRLSLIEDRSPEQPAGFLRLVRRRYRATYPDGSQSAPFDYDEVDRKAIDAVVIAAHFRDPAGPRVYLRSAIRPPIVMRDRSRSPLTEPDELGQLWELPAGLVEPGEQTLEGVREAARRELGEELGFDVDASALTELGPSTFPAPGVVAERHFFFAVEVDPSRRREPESDGSALEHFGRVEHVALDDALSWCRAGEIPDAKTEIALRRLAEQLA